jgi:hypothetical protein
LEGTYDLPQIAPGSLTPRIFNLTGDRHTLVRIYRSDFDHPERDAVAFNPNGPRGRFDHHRDRGTPTNDNERKVYYASLVEDHPQRTIFDLSNEKALRSCLAEVFLDRKIISNVAEQKVCWVKVKREMTLLDIRGLGAVEAGADARISGDRNRKYTQAWGRRFYEDQDNYPGIDGIIFTSARIQETAVMLYERAEGQLSVECDIFMNDPGLLSLILQLTQDIGVRIEPKGTS